MEESAAPVDASSSSDLKRQGDAAFDALDFVEALRIRREHLQSVQRSGPVEAEVAAHVSIGRVLATNAKLLRDMTRHYEEAVKACTKLPEGSLRVQLAVDALVELGRTLCRFSKLDAGLTQFQSAIALAKTDTESKRPYYVALTELGRVLTQSGDEKALGKAAAALQEAVEGTKQFGEDGELHALALAALGECRGKSKAAPEVVTQLFEKALACKQLQPVDRARILTYLGSVLSERNDAQARCLECFEEAIKIRTSVFGEFHPSVAEVHLDVAAEYFSQEKFQETVATLERALPYLNFEDRMMEVQMAWLKRALEKSGLSADEVKERHAAIALKRKQVEKTRKRLPDPKKDPNDRAASFLPAEPSKKPQQQQQKPKKKK